MKKFTFMLLATFIAIAAMAAGPEKRGMLTLNTNAVVTSSVKQVTPKAKAVKVQAPVTENLKKLTKKAKANVRKAPKKVEIADLLKADWMLCSDYYEYDSEEGGLVAATPAAGGTPITLEMVDETTIGIEGFTSDATEIINATISTTVTDDLQEQGIIAILSIPQGQKLFTNDTYGTINLYNASSDGDITAYVFEAGYVVFDDLWYAGLAGDVEEYAEYAGAPLGDYNYSFVVPVNGTMTWGKNSVPVYIEQDPENAKNVTVYNFGGFETAVDVNMKENKTFVIDEQIILYYNSEVGYLSLAGLKISDGSYYFATLTGVGTENALTFDVNWMLYAGNSLYFLGDPATITLIDGSEFTYPEIPDVAAVPNDPEIVTVGEYDAAKGYGYVIADVPTTDVDGNDLKESLLTYVLYADIEGEITPITFTPDLYENLKEDLTEIPYEFTDSYDFQVSEGYKVVFLNYDFTDYNQIGVQSIYYGGGEVNATEIQWYFIKDYAFTGGDATFDFNKMDVPVSATGVSDGDITETKKLTADIAETGDKITLAISPSDERCSTPNRFWSTAAGPQLRVYSGTLTFEVPAGYTMTNMVFNYNSKYWGGSNNAGYVTADTGEITDDASAKQATWTGDAQSVVFSIGYYDEETGKWVSGNTQLNSIVVTLAAAEIKPIEAPEDLVTETYIFQGFDTYFEEDVTSEVQVGFYGENEVYIQGLSTGYVPDAWVKGTIEEGVVTIPETYLGVWNYDGTDYEVTFAGASFIYDAEAETFTSKEGYNTYTGKYLLDEFSDVILTKKTTPVVTVSDALYATYVAPTDVDFTGAGVTAYAATFDGTYVLLEEVTTVPAGTAVIVKAAEAGTYEVNKTEDAVLGATNELIAATEDIVADGTQYVLAKPEGKPVGFYRVTAGSTIAAGKGYMIFESAVKPFYPFAEDDATGIESLNANANLDGVIYNVAGQRVSKAQKGINIINGKKILK